MASLTHTKLKLSCCMQKQPLQKQPISHNYFHHFTTSLASTLKLKLVSGNQLLQQLPFQINVISHIKKNTNSVSLLDAVVDSMFEFSDQPLLPGQSNLAPVDELKEAVLVIQIEGEIPRGFPVGVYIRNGPNPYFGGLKSAKSILGRTNHVWIEGEGMLHALYFEKSNDDGSWVVVYNNRYVETETLKIKKQRNSPSFLPAIQGNARAVLAAALLNMARFGKTSESVSNTSVFEHAGKVYSIAENYIPQEINISTLETLGDWDVNGAWDRPFTSHPKRAPGTGEMVIIGVNAVEPFMELGVISANGKRLVHRADLKLKRCTFCHEVGVTERYNVITDFPLTTDRFRILRGGQLIKYSKEEYARIGIMPRYGDAESIQWFDVEPNCTLHIVNCFEDGDEVVVRGCRALDSIIPGPELDEDKVEWFTRAFKPTGSLFTRCYEWRLNMKTGQIKERFLTGTDFSMDFPMINGDFTGVKNKYGYTQVVDPEASSKSAMGKFGGLAKLYFEEADTKGYDYANQIVQEMIKVEYHKLEKNTFCTGAAFVPKEGCEEDDGWIITFVHNEDTNISQVYIIDTKKFCSEPVAKITLPCRVPYGFHGAFMPIPLLQDRERRL